VHSVLSGKIPLDYLLQVVAELNVESQSCYHLSQLYYVGTDFSSWSMMRWRVRRGDDDDGSINDCNCFPSSSM